LRALTAFLVHNIIFVTLLVSLVILFAALIVLTAVSRVNIIVELCKMIRLRTDCCSLAFNYNAVELSENIS